MRLVFDVLRCEQQFCQWECNVNVSVTGVVLYSSLAMWCYAITLDSNCELWAWVCCIQFSLAGCESSMSIKHEHFDMKFARIYCTSHSIQLNCS